MSDTICCNDSIKEQVMNAISVCRIPDIGTFAFIKESETAQSVNYVLKVFRTNGTESSHPLSREKRFEFGKMVVLDDCNIKIQCSSKEAPNDFGFFNTTGKWGKNAVSFKRAVESRITVISNFQETQQKSRLAKVRQYGHFDFTIVCRDKKEIPVHSIILASQWSFFRDMLDSNMAESSSKTLELDCPVEWIEAIVSHFYEERKKLDFDTAVGVIIVAQMYNVPDLLVDAMRRIKDEKMTHQQAIETWQKVKMHNKAVGDYCAKQMKENMGELHSDESAQGKLQELTQLELVELLNNLSLSAKGVEKK